VGVAVVVIMISATIMRVVVRAWMVMRHGCGIAMCRSKSK
jgi:LDH2 family malate/lactate/ureidoglycolate dehydrogenase